MLLLHLPFVKSLNVFLLFTDEKQWDAFISYKSHPVDEQYVLHELYPRLEKEFGFKLCLHFRDFVPGESKHISPLFYHY